jgi:hypothetical protein
MERTDLPELHFITEISNVPSILQRGILSNVAARRLKHVSVAMLEIQDRRAKTAIPNGRPLHEYANLYISARNPMLSRLRAKNLDLCVLRVHNEVLDLPNVVIADGNAASEYTRFWPSPEGLSAVDAGVLFAEFWTDPDQIVAWRNRRIRCAEVLVPERVDVKHITGAYVSNQQTLDSFQIIAPGFSVQIHKHLFF